MHSGKFLRFETKQVPDVAPLTTNFRPTILANVGCTTFFWYYCVVCVRDSSLLEIDCWQLLGLWFQSYFKVRLYFFSWIEPGGFVCIVIAVLSGIEISDKLFTPEMVVPVLSIHDSSSELWCM